MQTLRSKRKAVLECFEAFDDSNDGTVAKLELVK
eukprot:SAG31_NODE_29368_length_396_cov_1.020202_2_plen_33_part_01